MDPQTRETIDQLIAKHLPSLPAYLPPKTLVQIDDLKTQAKQALLRAFIRQGDAQLAVMKWAQVNFISFTREERRMKMTDFFEREEGRGTKSSGKQEEKL